MLTTRDKADFVHFNSFFLLLFPGHKVPTPTLSSSKNVSRVIAINRDNVIWQGFVFYVTNLENSSRKVRIIFFAVLSS